MRKAQLGGLFLFGAGQASAARFGLCAGLRRRFWRRRRPLSRGRDAELLQQLRVRKNFGQVNARRGLAVLPAHPPQKRQVFRLLGQPVAFLGQDIRLVGRFIGGFRQGAEVLQLPAYLLGLALGVVAALQDFGDGAVQLVQHLRDGIFMVGQLPVLEDGIAVFARQSFSPGLVHLDRGPKIAAQRRLKLLEPP